MNTILVIGKYGQVAQAFKQVKTADKIIWFDRTEVDITQIETIEEKINKHHPTHIINTSAFHVLAQCEEFPKKAMEINTVANFNLAKLCKKNQIQLVIYSTDYVFDGQKKTPYTETDVPNPLQIYGISKLAGEYAACNYYQEGVTIIRTNGVYGGKDGSRDKKGNFVLTILNQAKTNAAVSVTANMTVSPTYATDLAKATHSLITKKAPPGIYHIINEGSCTWPEFAQKIVDYARIPIQVQTPNVQTHDIHRPQYSVLANTKAKQLGIILPSWKNALKRYIIDELSYE